MAEVTVEQKVSLSVTDKEWRLIMKGLGLAAGLKVSIKPEERNQAAVLNRELLGQRVGSLRSLLNLAEGAMTKAEFGFVSEPHVVGTEPPTKENDPSGRMRETKMGEEEIRDRNGL